MIQRDPLTWGLSLERLSGACESGDAADAHRELRWGNSGSAGQNSGVDIDAQWWDRSWVEITRLPETTSDAPLAFEAILSAMSGLDHEFVVLVGAGPSCRPSVWIGLPQSDDVVRWFRRLVSPNVLVEPTDGRPLVAEIVDRAQHALETHSRSLRLNLIPTGQAVEARDTASVLHRLLSIPSDSWAFAMTLRPFDSTEIDSAADLVAQSSASAAQHIHSSTQLDEEQSVSFEDPAMSNIAQWLELLGDRFTEGRSSGLWSVSMAVFGWDPSDVRMVIAAASTALRPANGVPARWVCDELASDGQSPLATSVFTTADVARLLDAPSASTGSLQVSGSWPAGRVSPGLKQPLVFGRFLGTDEDLVLDVEDLDGHGFVVGATGSGKSNTTGRLLTQLWNRHGIPFLVIDPVKDEYAQLGSILTGDLRVVNATDLRMNVLEPWPGFDRVGHLGLVSNAFRGSFSMPTPVPYVLRLLFDRLAARPSGSTAPSLHDLAAELESLVASLGYRGEVEANIKASLGTRLSVLTNPLRAEMFSAPSSRMIFDSMTTPTVFQLGGIADEEERSFVMTMLALYAMESSRLRGPTFGVAHVTVIEEAHRVIPEVAAAGSGGGDGTERENTSAQLFTALLKEVRSFGESMLIVDQSPNAVSREAIRNTNLKVGHRLIDQADRDAVGGAFAMDSEESDCLARLGVGQVVCGVRRSTHPFVALVDSVELPLSTPTSAALDRDSVRNCCAHPGDHHRAEALAPLAEHVVGGALAAAIAGDTCNVRAELGWMSAQHQQVWEVCLYAIGLRRQLDRFVGFGIIDIDERDAGLVGLYAANIAEHLAEIAEHLRSRLARSDRPFSGCVHCPSPCAARGWASSGLMGAGEQLRQDVDRAPSILGAASRWALSTLAGLRDTSTGTAGRAVVYCSVLHESARLGLGTDRYPLLPADSDLSPSNGVER